MARSELDSLSPLEDAVAVAFPYLAGALVAVSVLLAVPADTDPFVLSIVHLSAVVAVALVIAIRLAPLSERDWFAGRAWAPWRRRLAGSVSLVVIVTGVTGLLTLASSAALRFQPSLQFLQLLSALDISWAAGAVIVGGHRLWSRRIAGIAGVVVGVACVASIWNYLRVVGFTGDGGWLVDGAELMRLVIPFDMLAAIVAGLTLVWGARRP